MDHRAQPTDAAPSQSKEPSETSAIYPSWSRFPVRLATFENPNWPSKHQDKIVKLASIGFFYTGTADMARCFYCGLGLGDWTKDDDPYEEHRSHGPGCNCLNKFRLRKPCVYQAEDARSALSRQPCNPSKCAFCKWEHDGKNHLPMDNTTD